MSGVTCVFSKWCSFSPNWCLRVLQLWRETLVYPNPALPLPPNISSSIFTVCHRIALIHYSLASVLNKELGVERRCASFGWVFICLCETFQRSLFPFGTVTSCIQESPWYPWSLNDFSEQILLFTYNGYIT